MKAVALKCEADIDKLLNVCDCGMGAYSQTVMDNHPSTVSVTSGGVTCHIAHTQR